MGIVCLAKRMTANGMAASMYVMSYTDWKMSVQFSCIYILCPYDMMGTSMSMMAAYNNSKLLLFFQVMAISNAIVTSMRVPVILPCLNCKENGLFAAPNNSCESHIISGRKVQANTLIIMIGIHIFLCHGNEM